MERIIGGYVLKDLGSTNGIKLNGERVDKISLRNGQDIQIGDVDFGFELDEEEITALRLEDPTSSLPPLDESPKEKSATKTSPEIELKDEPEKKELPKEKAESKADSLPDLKSDPDHADLKSAPQPEPEPLPELKPEPQNQVQPDVPVQQEGIQQIPAAPQQGGLRQAVAQFRESDDGKYNKLIGILAVVAFLVGIALHFQRSTGESIINSIIQKLFG